jgi:hypothetical protein
VPWAFVIECDDAMRSALCIIAGELDGGVFDWSNMAWRSREAG